MAFKLPELEYDYNALEPYIDAKTVEIHHDKHHAKYLKKFNEAIEGTSLENMTPENIFAEVSKHPEAVRKHGGGYYNHALYWKMIGPGTKEKPEGDLLQAIENDFGSFEDFKSAFSEAAAGVFGSGWAWLIKNQNDQLEIVKTQNQDNPLMDIVDVKGKPILTIDVWEHAYYLKYQNKRPDYIEAFWNIINWDEVERLYKQ